ncbi:MAG TPA: hypothetical protein VMV91_05435 [Rhodocyclaceae bacterium]|nr:hypothetical protein [Rhodocyclaceae bacterium]
MMKIASKVVTALSFCALLAALSACQQEHGSGHDIGKEIERAGQVGHAGD